MINNDEKEYLENQFLENNDNIQTCIANKLENNKEIIKFFFLCLCFVIVFKPIQLKLKNPSNPICRPYSLGQPELINMYIVTHKDFTNNVIDDPYYKILCDERSQLKNEYKLQIIESNKDNILYPRKYGYCEGSKIYPIWKQYKSGILNTKYVGVCHYRRVFPFKNEMLDLDGIFKDYDVILFNRYDFGRKTIRDHFEEFHLIRTFDEVINIAQEMFPEYAQYAKNFVNKNWGNFCNIFIMKKEDFIKWGDFVYGILLEFDRRHNLNNDQDIRNFVTKEIKETHKNFDINYQSRLEGFLMERIANIFYDKHFTKRYELPTGEI